MRLLLLLLLLLAIAAVRAQLVLVEGNCSARIVCPLAFDVAESVCPVEPPLDELDPCTGSASSCCPLLDFSAPDVNGDVGEFALDAATNPFADMGITVGADSTALVTREANNRVLLLPAGARLTLVAPARYPFCVLTITTRALGASSLRLMAAGQSTYITSDSAEPFYADHALSGLCRTPEVTLLNSASGSAVYVQLLGLCLIGAHDDPATGVCNGANGIAGESVDALTITTAPKAVLPFVSCNRRFKNHTCLSFFGYNNRNDDTVEIVAGTLGNRFLQGPADQGQPSLFIPGVHKFVFSTVWNCTKYVERLLRWHLVTPTVKHHAQPRDAEVVRTVNNCPKSVL
jgi:hypothetical protein